MMQNVIRTYYGTTEQHKEMVEARRIRDKKDSPFGDKEDLYNITTGESGS